MQKLVIYTDGGSRGNPGPSAIGVEIYLHSEQTKKIFSFGKKIGLATNNIAEYTAVIEAYNWLIENKEKLPPFFDIDFFLDSRLVVNQLNGLFKIKNQNLLNFIFIIKNQQQKFQGKISYTYIQRSQNTNADFLVNQALDA